MARTSHLHIMNPLVGDELLNLVRDHSSLPRETLVEKAGYAETDDDGNKIFNYAGFYAALLAAKNIDLKAFASPERSGGGGRKLGWITSCQKNSSVLLGAGYLKQNGFAPGDSFRIECKPGKIRLIPVETQSEL